MQDKLSILHVLTAPRAEGTPRIVMDWLRISGRVNQSVLFLSEGDEQVLKDFELQAHKVVINTKNKSGFHRIIQIILRTRRAIKITKPALVISWSTGPSQWVFLGAKISGVKNLIVHVGNPPSRSGLISRYVFTWLTFWMAGLLGAQAICCSKYVRSAFLKIPFMPEKIIHSVYNCFDHRNFSNENTKRLPGENFAIMVATLEKHKDHETLLRAWSMIEKNKSTVHLWLAGDGSLRTELENLAISLGLRALSFLGSRNDIPNLLRQSSVFILSTTASEGFGTVLLEALASGLPVIATDVPACREVLQDGKYGTLVPPRDPESLARAILFAFDHPLSGTQVKINREYASSFTPEQMMGEYLRLSDPVWAGI